MTVGHILAWIFVVLVFFGPMLFRLSRPIPATDREAIKLFIENRDQTLLNMRKLWVGGPGQWGRGLYRQEGRPYRLLVRSRDGSRWKHDVVMLDHVDRFGNREMRQRLDGVWTPVIQ